MSLEADRVETGQDGRVRATGDPSLRFGGASLSAERIDLLEAERKIFAEGDVLLEDADGNAVRGERLEYDFAGRAGSVEPAEITGAEGERGRIGGSRLTADGSDYEIEDAYYTTCPADMETWKVVAEHFEYDAEGKVARAESAVLMLGDVPVFYLPRMSFSADRTERKSGFLTPSLEKHSRRWGLRTPYYFNLAPNYDATLEPLTLEDGEISYEGEARYLARLHSGVAGGGFVPSDGLRGSEDRYVLRATHAGAAADGLTRWGAEYLRVSDDDYLRDFSTDRDEIASRNLPVRAFVEREHGDFRASALAERIQHLRDDSERPYDRLPQAALDYGAHHAGFDVESRTEFTNFRSRETGAVEGARLRETLEISRTFGAGPRVVPAAGIEAAGYSLQDAPGDSSPGYAVPFFTLDGSLPLVRETSLLGVRVEQTLEPRVLYGYAPDRSFGDVPIFDTAVADVNYATLYDRRRFSGGDRVSNVNFLSYGVTSRLWDVERGREFLEVNLVQRVNFDDPDVLLPEEPASDDRLSNLYASADFSPSDPYRGAVRLAWDPDQSRMVLIETAAQARLDRGRVFSMAFIKTIEEDGAVDSDVQTGAVFPVSERLRALAQVDYSIEENHLSSGEVGVRYRGKCECWEVSAVAERFVESEGINETTVYLKVELLGLTGIGVSRFESREREIGSLW